MLWRGSPSLAVDELDLSHDNAHPGQPSRTSRPMMPATQDLAVALVPSIRRPSTEPVTHFHQREAEQVQAAPMSGDVGPSSSGTSPVRQMRLRARQTRTCTIHLGCT